jgi:hypothetical protein
VEKSQIHVSMRLVPGVAVSSLVLASVDADGDGVISPSEQRIYAEQVLRDLSLTVDGKQLKPRVTLLEFPQIEDMKVGLGEILIEFTADLPEGGPNRKLIFENHHQRRIAAYMVNCLVPRDPGIQIVAQHRDELQSFYQLDYVQAVESKARLFAK